ncbi:uncharacterized protein [Periplaneta americana]|uniref:uncharacterized protein n=1 Tax=Periplaneta americana TaxID=6978 RepID=UPI0037E7552F
MLPPRPRAATTSRRQYNEEKKRRLKSTVRDVKTPQLPARHDTTGKLAKLMMADAATQTSSSDHFEESSRRYAEWDEEVRLEEVRHLWRVAIGLFEFSMHKDCCTRGVCDSSMVKKKMVKLPEHSFALFSSNA